MVITKYIHIIFAIIVWAYIFIFIKPKRIKELLPIGAVSFIILFGIELYLRSLDLYKFNNPSIPILGIPLFHLVWGAGSGIVFMNYIKKGFFKKILIITIFTLITMGFETISESIGASSDLGKFTEIHNAIQDFLTLSFLLWVSEGLFIDRIYSKKT